MNRRTGVFMRGVLLSMVLGLSGILPVAGCGGEAEKEIPKAHSRIRVEDASWEDVNGKNVHEFTLVNSNELAVKGIVVRFRYLDSAGEELGTAEKSLPSLVYAHDSIRQMAIETGAVFPGTRSVSYEVVKARATWQKGKK